MFNKFKKGDVVLKLSDMTKQYYVRNVFKEKSIYHFLGEKKDEIVVLNDGTTIEADRLTFFSEPIFKLAILNQVLVNENIELKKKVIDNYSTLNGKMVELQKRLDLKEELTVCSDNIECTIKNLKKAIKRKK